MPYVPGIGMLVDQEPLAPGTLAEQLAEVQARHEAAIAEAWEYLTSQDLDPWDIAELNLGYNKVRHLWYSDEFGGVYPGHPDGRLVLYVELPEYDIQG